MLTIPVLGTGRGLTMMSSHQFSFLMDWRVEIPSYCWEEFVVRHTIVLLWHPSFTLSYPHKTHTTTTSDPVLTIPAGYPIWPWWLVLMDCWVEIPSYWCERLVWDMAQLRHPSITRSCPHKTHTTSEPVLTIPAGLGSDLTPWCSLSISHGLNSWKPKVLMWETCWRHGTALRHPDLTLMFCYQPLSWIVGRGRYFV